MRKNYLSIISMFLLSVAGFSQATMEEYFDYGGSNDLLVSVTSTNWVVHSGGTTGPVLYDASSNLTMTGYSFDLNGGVASISNTGAQDISAPINITCTSVTDPVIYASTLVNISAATTSGDYFFHFKDAGFGYTVRTYAKDDGTGKLLFGVRETVSGTITYGSTQFDYNTTYLMIIKYDFLNDEAKVYVLDAATPIEPASPEVSDATGTAPGDIQMVSLRQATNGVSATFDALRTATTWADLFPAGTLTVSSSSTDATCNGAMDGVASITVTGGTTPYSYLWDGGSTTDMQDGLGAGVQSLMVTITDAASVTEAHAVNVTIAEPTAITITETMTAATCGNSNGSITVTATGGSGSYNSYVWNNASTIAIASGLASGTHNVTVTDTDGCSASASFNMNPSDGPSVTVTTTNVSCNTGNDGELMLAVSGGVTPYTYAWSGSSSTTASATGLSPNTYMVTVTGNGGCYTVESMTITEPTALSASMTGTDETTSGAADGTLTVSATGGTMPYSYTWTGGSTSTSATKSGLAVGTYSSTVSDANGCSATTNMVTISAGVSITPIYDIQYVASNVPEVSDASPLLNSTVLIQGVVTAIIDKGAGKSQGYWIQDAEALWSGIYVQDPTNYLTVSRGDELRVNAKVAEYFTSTQLTNVTSIQTMSTGNMVNPVVISTLDSKTEAVEGVLVRVLNANCDTVASGATFGVWTVNDGSGPAEIENDIYSYGQEVLNENYDVTGVGYYSFGDMFIAPRDINDINIACPYTLTETISDVTCNGAADGSIALTATGATNITYTWDNGASTATVNGLGAGNYNVSVDGDGCVLTKGYSIVEPTAISISSSVTNTSCGTSVGAITVSATGGSGSYTSYSWSNSSTGATITGLANGSYTVTVTDSDACTKTKVIGVNSTDGPNITLTETNITCNNDNDGQVVATVSGGATPYTYMWSNSATTSTIASLAEGMYDVTVTDNAACAGFATGNIMNPSVISISVAITQESATGASDGSAVASATGGTGAITYAWSNGANTATASGLTEGMYTVTATDANGCTSVETIEIGGSTPIYDIQYTTTGPDYISPLNGQNVKIKGYVTAKISKGTTIGYWVQDAEALWSGIYVQDNVNTPAIGDEVSLKADVTEFFNSTQLTNITAFTTITSGNTTKPVVVSTADVSTEAVEGVLIAIAGAQCTEVASGANFGVWSVDDGSGVAKVENDIFSYGSEVVGTKYCVTGVGYYTFNVMYIAPRDANDVEANCTQIGIDEVVENTISIYPNPASSVITIASADQLDRITITDIRGTIVYTTTLINSGTKVTVDINNFAEGIYNIQTVSGTNLNNAKVVVVK